jgi:tryptophan synthase alpha chain
MPSRLRRRFAQSKAERRGVLFGYLPAGYPTPDDFLASAAAAFDAGLDALEVGLPSPVPDLDGPLIKAAIAEGSRHVPTVREALQLAASARRDDDDSIIALAYGSLFERVSVDDFLQLVKDADVDAVLLPQASVADQLDISRRAARLGIDVVVFLHLEEDLPVLVATSDDPIIYLQSAALRTGGQFNPDKAQERLRELAEAFDGRPYSVCVGFGVRGREDVAALMAGGADGAIIGTRLVAAAGERPADVGAIVDEVAPVLVRRAELGEHPDAP